MKKLIVLGFVLLLLVACGPATPSADMVATAIAETQAAAVPTATPMPPTATIDPFELTKAANQTQNAAHEATANAMATNIALTPTSTLTWTPRPTSTPRPSATPTLEAGTRNNPYPIGYTLSLVQAGELEFTISVTEVTRGADAWTIIRQANQFNDPAPEGLEFIVFRAIVVYTGPDKGALELNESYWSTVSKGRVYDQLDSFICCLEPEFDFTLFSSGEAEGLIALLVSMDDPNPLIVFGLKSDGSGGWYFSATP